AGGLQPAGPQARRGLPSARRARARRGQGRARVRALGRGGGAVSLARGSLQRPVTATMFFVSMMVVGLIAAFRLPLEFLPEIEAPCRYVDLPYPGSSPPEIEEVITRPVEEALATLPGIKRMNSQTRSEGAGVFLEFQWDRDIQI